MTRPSSNTRPDISISGGNSYIFIFLFTSFVYLTFASLVHRGLYSDGVLYFLKVFQEQSFSWSEPGGLISHLIMKLPVVIAMRFGYSDIQLLSSIYTASLLFLPFLLVCLSYYALPRDKKYLFIFPAAFYLTSITASSFCAIAGSQFGVAYFWPLAFVLYYATAESVLRKMFILFLCIPAVLLHETYVLFGLLLIGICLLRYTKESRRFDKYFWILIASWFVIVVIVSADNIINPRTPSNRAAYFEAMIGLKFLIGSMELYKPQTWQVNGPGLIGVIGILAGAIIFFFYRLRWLNLLITAITAFLSVAIALDVFTTYKGFWPIMHYYARTYPSISCFGAILLLALVEYRRVPDIQLRVNILSPLIIVLSICQMTWHLGASAHWQNFLRVYQQDVNTLSGFIPFVESSISLDSINGKPIRRMVVGWTIPALSLFLARDGNVKTIIATPTHVPWQPWDPPKVLPKLPNYSYQSFRAALGEEKE